MSCAWGSPLAFLLAASVALASINRTIPKKTIGEERLAHLRRLATLLRDYDRRLTPTSEVERPTEVGCELFFRSLRPIGGERATDYQADVYLMQHWEDPRLSIALDIGEDLEVNDPKLVQAMWKPEVYFPTATAAEFQYVTVPNVMIRISPGGLISYILRLTLTLSCAAEPPNMHVCALEVASFSRTTREVLLRWNTRDAVKLGGDLKIPQFTVEGVETGHCEESPWGTTWFPMANHSCLAAKIRLRRVVTRADL